MDSNQLFWATGIDNSKLDADAKAAEAIFNQLSSKVEAHLNRITTAYGNLAEKANVKFTNPIDETMLTSITNQIKELGNVIKEQNKALANFSASYDTAIQKINKAASNVGKNIPANSPLQTTVKAVRKDVDDATNILGNFEKVWKRAVQYFVAYGSINWTKDFIAQMITVKGQLDQMKVAINSFVGDSVKGAKVFQEFVSFAVTSPFNIDEITYAGRQLLAYGDTAENVTKSIKMLSDVSAGSGQSLKDVAYLYGTSMTQGRLYARDLFQFANRGIPIYTALAGVMGITTDELMKQVKLGKVNFDQLKSAIEQMTAAGGQYYGISDKLAQTTYGKISNLKDRWIVMLNEMGTASDGTIRSAIEVLTEMIGNWKEVVKWIEAAVAAYGTYRTVMMIQGATTGLQNFAMYQTEAASLEGLVSVEYKAALAKQGLKIGSYEYVMALRAETTAILTNMDATIAQSTAEVSSLEKSLASSTARVAAAEKNVLVKEAELSATMTVANADNLAAAKKELNTLATEQNSIATDLNTAKTNLSTVSKERETLATNIDTAAQAGNAAGTDLLAAAKLRLIAIAKSLYVTLLANPYTALAIAIGAVVAALIIFTDNTTEAEKAQKRLKEANDQMAKSWDTYSKKFGDLLNVIKNKAAADQQQIDAYNELKRLYPSIIGSMTLENLKREDAVRLQKKVNEQQEMYINVQKRIQLAEAQRREEGAKRAYESVKYGNRDYLRERYDAATIERAAIQKEVEDSNKRLQNANKNVAQSFENPKTAASDLLKEIKNLNTEISKLRSGKIKSTDIAGDIEDRQKQIRDLQSQYRAITGIDLTGKGVKKGDTRQADINSAIVKNENDVTQLRIKAEIERQQQIIDLKDEGSAKELAQIQLNYDKQYAAAVEFENKILREAQDTEKKQWQKKYGNVNGAKFTPTILTTSDLSKEDKSAIAQKYSNAYEGMYVAENKYRKQVLEDLQDFNTQRDNIEKEYTDRVAYLSATRTETNAKETDSAIDEAKRVKDNALSEVNLKELQKQINWGEVFGNLDEISSSTLQNIKEKLIKIISEANGSLSKIDTKTLVDGLEKINSKLLDRNPISAIIGSYKDYRNANEDLIIAINQVHAAKEDLDNILNSGASEKEQKTATDELAKAENNLASAQKKVSQTSSNLKINSKEIVEEFGKVIGAIGEFSSVLDSIGASDETKKFFSSSMDILEGGTKFAQSIQSGDIAGAISGAIQQTKGYIDLIGDLFGSSYSTKYYEQLSDSLGRYIDTLKEVVSSQKDALSKTNGMSAIQQGEEAKKNIESDIEAYRKLAQAAGKAGASIGSHSYAYRTNEKLKNYWGAISKSAGETVDNINDLYSMTPQQLEKIRNENAYAWSQINEDIRKNLEGIISSGTDLEDIIKQTKEQALGISFDDLESSFDDWITSADSSMSDLADNFEDYMKKAILGFVKDKYLTEALTSWYDDYYKAIDDGSLTEDETRDLQKKWDDIADNAKKQYDQAVQAAGIDSGSTSSSVKTGIQGMSESTADILTAQFSAIRLNVADIVVYLSNQGNVINAIATNIAEIAVNTRDLAYIKKYLNDMIINGLKVK